MTTVPSGSIELARVLIVMDVLVGFLNSGGDLETVSNLLSCLQRGSEQYKIELPEGWKMIDWINESSDEFVLMNEKEGLVHRIIPESFAETMPAAQYLDTEDADIPDAE